MDLKQVHGEYAYGAPTGMFNMSCIHLGRKAALSYQQPESY